MNRDDEYMNWVDRTAARGSNVERVAGGVFVGLLGVTTIGAIISGLAWIGSIVWGWLS